MAAAEPNALGRIPLTVLGGFLGAGKTSVLNYLLTTTQRRVAVLVNDFGPINIDASLIVDQEGGLINLSNGCVCCSLGGGLTEALASVLARDPLPEWIVVEASGVSDPGRIAQVGMADPMLQLEGVVVLVDAAAVREQMAQPLLADTLSRQLAAADLLVLNKIDLVSAEAWPALRAWLENEAPGAPIVQTQEGRIDLLGLLEVGGGSAASTALVHQRPAPECCPDPSRCHGNSAGHRHDHAQCAGVPDHPFESHFWLHADVLNADQLTQRLKQLPRAVLRAKGWVRTDRHGVVLVQFAGRRVRYDTTTVPPEALQATGLVLIGMRGQDWVEIDGLLEQAKADIPACAVGSGASESPSLVLDPLVSLT